MVKQGSGARLRCAHPGGITMRPPIAVSWIVLAAACLAAPALAAEGDYTLRDFAFHSGEKLPELRIHYLTMGKPLRDARGRTSNAVLILHGTGGSGRQFLAPQFAGVLFG